MSNWFIAREHEIELAYEYGEVQRNVSSILDIILSRGARGPYLPVEPRFPRPIDAREKIALTTGVGSFVRNDTAQRKLRKKINFVLSISQKKGLPSAPTNLTGWTQSGR